MIIKCYNEHHNYLLFIDLEFSKDELVQFSGLLFQRIDDETYQLMRSINTYITAKICYPFVEYTGIKSTFLAENGIPLADAVKLIRDDFLADVPINEILLISHGLKNDRIILKKANLNFTYNNQLVDGYCTFNNAKRILNRNSNLTLANIAEEAGYYLHHAHNAFNDVWAEVAVFTYLKKIEKQNENDRKGE